MILIGQEELNGLRTLAAKIKHAGNVAMRTYGHGQGERLEEVIHLAAQLETRLDQAGAARPSVLAQPDMIPPSLLDTPANRRKAQALREAYEAALEVDRERYGDRIGTDGEAQAVEMLLADVEEELRGPVGLVRE